MPEQARRFQCVRQHRHLVKLGPARHAVGLGEDEAKDFVVDAAVRAAGVWGEDQGLGVEEKCVGV